MKTGAATAPFIGIMVVGLGLFVAACDDTPAYEESVETLFAACDADRSPAFEGFASSPTTVSAEAAQRAVDRCDARVQEWLPLTATPACIAAVDEYRGLNRSMMRRLALVVAMRQQGVPPGTYGESGPEFLAQAEAVEQHVVSSCTPAAGENSVLAQTNAVGESANAQPPPSRPSDGRIREVPRGSLERSVIMDALRPTAEREYRAPVEFVVLELRRSDTVVFASVQPQRPGGDRIDCGYDNCRPVGRMDAILQPDENGWRVVDVQTDADDRWRMQYCSQLPVGLVRECD